MEKEIRIRGSASAIAGMTIVAMVVSMSRRTEATDHIVGANRGWQLPADAGPDAHLNYTIWASQHIFLLNDELTFNYVKGAHTVFEVNYSTYVNCTFSMWYGRDWIYNRTNRGGKTKLILNESRPHYFACGMGDHCKQGMKVAINVTTNVSATNSTKLSSAKSNESDASRLLPLLGTLICSQVFLVLIVRLLCPSL
ncbi:hypothetical protein KP509_34G064400 [Ceratopteris richardii]|uniref:Phytocyanin domain-containing protein n=1 Tax=Ceratopteris richardii TaxID=49495 RepID=A0A8T2QM53_CERRI|nr:hypothetical protein KP509_34G064400 [Ceratopteris richardii]